MLVVSRDTGPMKPTTKQRISLLVGFLVLFGIAGVVLLLFRAGWRQLASAQAPLAAAVVAGSATVLVSILSVVTGKFLENRSKLREEHRQKKVPVYEKLIQFLFQVLFAEKLGEEPLSETKINEFFSEFMPELVIWGDGGVIKSFGDMREFSAQLAESERAIEVMFLYERVLLEIRRDLGHSPRELRKGDLLRLFITDIRRYL